MKQVNTLYYYYLELQELRHEIESNTALSLHITVPGQDVVIAKEDIELANKIQNAYNLFMEYYHEQLDKQLINY